MKWYVVYTKPRWEKKVYHLLQEEGIEAYCPMNRVRKQWSDRLKWVEEPLFKSYVFVRLSEDEMAAVRLVRGVINYVYWLGRPAVVREKEIGVIRRFLDGYAEVWAEPVVLRKDARVIIRKGVLMDREATIVQMLNNKVQVIIESIGYCLIAVIEKDNLVPR